MRKSDKKTEKTLVDALREACEQLLEGVEGFIWLTHFCDHSDFPASLTIVCVFDSNENLTRMLQTDEGSGLIALLNQRLGLAGIEIHDIKAHIQFDTEQACQEEHNGKWKLRFS